MHTICINGIQKIVMKNALHMISFPFTEVAMPKAQAPLPYTIFCALAFCLALIFALTAISAPLSAGPLPPVGNSRSNWDTSARNQVLTHTNSMDSRGAVPAGAPYVRQPFNPVVLEPGSAEEKPLLVAAAPAEKRAPVVQRTQKTKDTPSAQKTKNSQPTQKSATAKQTSAPAPKVVAQQQTPPAPATLVRQKPGQPASNAVLSMPMKNKPLPKAGVETFKPSVFGQPCIPPECDPNIQKTIAQVSKKYQAKGQGNATGRMLENASVTISGNPAVPADAEALARHRRALPGQYHTMSQIDEYTPPEAHLNYKIDHATTARLAINEQDQKSPTYVPLRQEPTVNAAGLYIDTNVEKDVTLRVGGEVRSHETESSHSNERDSTAASVGLEWQF